MYGTQSSLDLDLQDLSSYSLTGSSSMVSDDDDAVTNSSMLYPDQPPTVDTPSWGNGFTDNNSGLCHCCLPVVINGTRFTNLFISSH